MNESEMIDEIKRTPCSCGALSWSIEETRDGSFGGLPTRVVAAKCSACNRRVEGSLGRLPEGRSVA